MTSLEVRATEYYHSHRNGMKYPEHTEFVVRYLRDSGVKDDEVLAAAWVHALVEDIGVVKLCEDLTIEVGTGASLVVSEDLLLSDPRTRKYSVVKLADYLSRLETSRTTEDKQSWALRSLGVLTKVDRSLNQPLWNRLLAAVGNVYLP